MSSMDNYFLLIDVVSLEPLASYHSGHNIPNVRGYIHKFVGWGLVADRHTRHRRVYGLRKYPRGFANADYDGPEGDCTSNGPVGLELIPLATVVLEVVTEDVIPEVVVE